MNRVSMIIGAAVAATLFAAGSSPAQEVRWPREIALDDGTLTLYQPQAESLTGNVLSGRAAAAFLATGDTDPTFGTLWFDSRIDADSEEGTAEVRGPFHRTCSGTTRRGRAPASGPRRLRVAVCDDGRRRDINMYGRVAADERGRRRAQTGRQTR